MEEYISEAHQLWREGKEKEMLVPLKKALDISQEKNDIYKTIEIMSEYGGALRVVGFLDESVLVLSNVSELIKEHFGIENEQYNTSLVNTGNALRMQGKFELAEELFLTAKTNFEKLNMKEYPYASVCNNLALLYIATDRLSEAQELLEGVIDKLEAIEPYSTPLGITYNNLAVTSLEQERIIEAIQNCYLSKDVLEKTVGIEHPLYASTINTEAEIYYAQDNFIASLHLYKEASEIIEEAYGKDSSDYKNIQFNIQKCLDNLTTMISKPSKEVAGYGMNISYKFVKNELFPYLSTEFPDLLYQLALVLVGPGSECFGFDDEYSRDHDFFERCLLFIDEQQWNEFLPEMKLIKEKFGNKITFMSIETFYNHYTGYIYGPTKNNEFLSVEDKHLATATNGWVFVDFYGGFSKIRNKLLQHYPHDVLYKRLAYHSTQIAQSGQYNYERSLKRRNKTAALLSLTRFVEHYSHCIHLINKRYQPFYKWIEESMLLNPILGEETVNLFNQLYNDPFNADTNNSIIQQLCNNLVNYFNNNQLTDTKIDFLTYQAEALMKNIHDEKLRKSNPWTLQ